MWLNFTNLNRWQPRQQNAVKPSIPQPGNAPVAISIYLLSFTHTVSKARLHEQICLENQEKEAMLEWQIAVVSWQSSSWLNLESLLTTMEHCSMSIVSILWKQYIVWLETFMEGLVGEGKLFKHYSTNRIQMNSSWCIPCVHSCMHIWHFVSGLFQCGFTPDVLGIPLTFCLHDVFDFVSRCFKML